MQERKKYLETLHLFLKLINYETVTSSSFSSGVNLSPDLQDQQPKRQEPPRQQSPRYTTLVSFKVSVIASEMSKSNQCSIGHKILEDYINERISYGIQNVWFSGTFNKTIL